MCGVGTPSVFFYESIFWSKSFPPSLPPLNENNQKEPGGENEVLDVILLLFFRFLFDIFSVAAMNGEKTVGIKTGFTYFGRFNVWHPFFFAWLCQLLLESQ